MTTIFLPDNKPRNKYGAKRVQVDGIWFDSKAEAKRYGELKQLEVGGQIEDLDIHPEYDLHVGRVRLGKITLDFRYFDKTSRTRLVVEDVKSKPTRTREFLWKKKHLLAEYGIEVMEIMR